MSRLMNLSHQGNPLVKCSKCSFQFPKKGKYSIKNHTCKGKK